MPWLLYARKLIKLNIYIYILWSRGVWNKQTQNLMDKQRLKNFNMKINTMANVTKFSLRASPRSIISMIYIVAATYFCCCKCSLAKLYGSNFKLCIHQPNYHVLDNSISFFYLRYI